MDKNKPTFNTPSRVAQLALSKLPTTAVMLLSLLVLIASSCGTSNDTVVSSNEPAVSSTEPVVSSTEPAVSSTEPAVSTTEPALSSTEPAVSATQPTVTTTLPVVSQDEPTSGDQDTEPQIPTTVTDETGAVITVESIERIIPLDGDIAEVVFALGLGDKVVATDLSATYPPEADALPEIGYQRALSAEAVAAFNPTLLLATDIAGPPEALEDMRRLGFPIVVVPNEVTPDGAGRKIMAVANALGVPSRGEVLAQEVDQGIAEATVVPNADSTQLKVLALYLRGTSTQLVLGESSNTHWLIEAAGGVDVSVSMGITNPTPVSAEAILAAAPDVVLLPEAGLFSVNGVDGLLEIGGIGQTPAGLARNVLAYDDQLLLGNGPRTAAMLTQLRDDLADIATKQLESS